LQTGIINDGQPFYAGGVGTKLGLDTSTPMRGGRRLQSSTP